MKKLLKDCTAKEILTNWESNYNSSPDKKFILNIPKLIHNNYNKYNGKISLEDIFKMIKPYLSNQARDFEFEVGDDNEQK